MYGVRETGDGRCGSNFRTRYQRSPDRDRVFEQSRQRTALLQVCLVGVGDSMAQGFRNIFAYALYAPRNPDDKGPLFKRLAK
jgi:hypothetical protein